MKKVLTVTMDGIRYHASRPADCRHCFFWKNRKKGCVLGKENCYYLIAPPKGPSKCEGCPYKRAKPCVLGPCYKDLMAPLEKRSSAPCSALHPVHTGISGSETAEICSRAVLERLDIIIHEA